MSRFSLEAIVSPSVDQKAAEREGKKLGDTFEEEIGGLSPEADMGSFRGSQGGGRRAGGGVGAVGGVAAGRGLAGGAGGAGMIGTALKGLGVGAALFGILQGVQKLAKSSPALQQVGDMFGSAMSLFFRPFGNFLAGILRPASMAMLQMGIKFNDIADNEGLLVGLGYVAGGVLTEIGEAIGRNLTVGDDGKSFAEIQAEMAQNFWGGVIKGIRNNSPAVDKWLNTIASKVNVSKWVDTIASKVTVSKWIDNIASKVTVSKWVDNIASKVNVEQWIDSIASKVNVSQWVNTIVSNIPSTSDWYSTVVSNIPGANTWVHNVVENIPSTRAWVNNIAHNAPQVGNWIDNIVANVPGTQDWYKSIVANVPAWNRWVFRLIPNPPMAADWKKRLVSNIPSASDWYNKVVSNVPTVGNWFTTIASNVPSAKNWYQSIVDEIPSVQHWLNKLIPEAPTADEILDAIVNWVGGGGKCEPPEGGCGEGMTWSQAQCKCIEEEDGGGGGGGDPCDGVNCKPWEICVNGVCKNLKNQNNLAQGGAGQTATRQNQIPTQPQTRQVQRVTANVNTDTLEGKLDTMITELRRTREAVNQSMDVTIENRDKQLDPF